MTIYSHLKYDTVSKHRKTPGGATEIHVNVIKMAFIKEENEDLKIKEAFSVKQEDTDTQTGWFPFSKLNSVMLSFLNCRPLQKLIIFLKNVKRINKCISGLIKAVLVVVEWVN